MRPGKGWKKLSNTVYEHISGGRIHVGGLLRFPKGDYLHMDHWPVTQDAYLFIRINGGNRKRGLMAWYVALISTDKKCWEGGNSYTCDCPDCGSSLIQIEGF
jgi:hypothetical protein